MVNKRMFPYYNRLLYHLLFWGTLKAIEAVYCITLDYKMWREKHALFIPCLWLFHGCYLWIKKKKTIFSAIQWAQIIKLCVEVYTECDISVRTGCSKMAFHNMITRYQLNGNFSYRKRSGRPRKTNPRENRVITSITSLSNSFM